MQTSDIKVGDRVQIAPHADAWMMGDRYGEVVRVGRRIIHVKMDRSGRVRWFHAESIHEVIPCDVS